MYILRKKIIVFSLYIISQLSLIATDYNFVSIENLIEQEISEFIIKRVYSNLNIDIKIRPLPALRAESMATNGEVDGEICRIYSYGDDKNTLIRVPEPYYIEKSTAFVKDNSTIKITKIDDLKKYRVGIIRGVKVSEDITLGHRNLLKVNSTDSLIKMLQHDRIDIAITSSVDGIFMLKKLDFTTNIKALSPPLLTVNLYHYLHVNNKDLVIKVNNEILRMKESGEMDALIKTIERMVTLNRIHF